MLVDFVKLRLIEASEPKALGEVQSLMQGVSPLRIQATAAFAAIGIASSAVSCRIYLFHAGNQSDNAAAGGARL